MSNPTTSTAHKKCPPTQASTACGACWVLALAPTRSGPGLPVTPTAPVLWWESSVSQLSCAVSWHCQTHHTAAGVGRVDPPPHPPSPHLRNCACLYSHKFPVVSELFLFTFLCVLLPHLCVLCEFVLCVHTNQRALALVVLLCFFVLCLLMLCRHGHPDRPP